MYSGVIITRPSEKVGVVGCRTHWKLCCSSHPTISTEPGPREPASDRALGGQGRLCPFGLCSTRSSRPKGSGSGRDSYPPFLTQNNLGLHFGRCEMKYVLLEMDRILHPDGYAIIRESSYFIDSIVTYAKGMRWGCQKQDTEYNIYR
uniref:Uncharacterized protein n=1 Tax=Ananas comosus var. bracteatus TaxID=296719 RepID=A0A6V7NSW3_ANACO|nr:unnamed protein product [Ananas comosus var. bracteatus]